MTDADVDETTRTGSRVEARIDESAFQRIDHEGASDPRGFLEDHHLEWWESFLDQRFRVPVIGYRFGMDGVMGLIPGVGDALTAGTSAIFIADAMKMGARKRTVAKMVRNVALDFVVGLIPLVGDLADFAFKSNVKNLALLRAEREHLRNGAGR